MKAFDLSKKISLGVLLVYAVFNAAWITILVLKGLEVHQTGAFIEGNFTRQKVLMVMYYVDKFLILAWLICITIFSRKIGVMYNEVCKAHSLPAKFSPGWAAASWLIPVAHLWLPYKNIEEFLTKIYQLGLKKFEIKVARAPDINLVWFLWIASTAGERVVSGFWTNAVTVDGWLIGLTAECVLMVSIIPSMYLTRLLLFAVFDDFAELENLEADSNQG